MTNDLDDLFGVSTDNDKKDAFDESTVSAILKLWGANTAYIKSLKRDNDGNFGSQWFNDQSYIDPILYTTRFFNFDLNDVFVKPHKSPVIQEALGLEKVSKGKEFVMVFKSHKLGRLVLKCEGDSSIREPTESHYITSICVPITIGEYTSRFFIYDFKEFFLPYKDDITLEPIEEND